MAEKTRPSQGWPMSSHHWGIHSKDFRDLILAATEPSPPAVTSFPHRAAKMTADSTMMGYPGRVAKHRDTEGRVKQQTILRNIRTVIFAYSSRKNTHI